MTDGIDTISGGRDVPANRSTAWQHRSKEIKQRDGYVCQRCGRSNHDRKYNPIVHQTHHIVKGDYLPVDDARIDLNLVTLCTRCHGRIEGNRVESQFHAIGREDVAAVLTLIKEGRVTPWFVDSHTDVSVLQAYSILEQLERLGLVHRLDGSLYEVETNTHPQAPGNHD